MDKVTNRVCGECTACCLTHAIFEIKKAIGVPCPLCEVSRGCRDYDHRPPSCQSFRCDWLKGFGDDSCRPDRVGIVRDTITNKQLQLWEVGRGRLELNLSLLLAIQMVLVRGAFLSCIYLSGETVRFAPPKMKLSKKMRQAMLRRRVKIILFPQFKELLRKTALKELSTHSPKNRP